MRLRNIKGSKEAVRSSQLVVQEPKKMKGQWRAYFGNEKPIFIEIGMGKGQFVIEHAKNNPEVNFIGIEKYSGVLFKALELMEAAELSNLTSIRMDALELLEVFEENEVDRIYLNFSDPWPKERHFKRRLTYKDFLDIYRVLLKPEGEIVFKSDNDGLFEFSLESFEKNGYLLSEVTRDLHKDEPKDNVRTEYEERFSAMGVKINRLIAVNQK